MIAERYNIVLNSNPRKVLLRPFYPSPEQSRSVLKRISELSTDDVKSQLEKVFEKFESRHKYYKESLRKRFDQIKNLSSGTVDFDEERKLLAGSYFLMEYAVKSAAIFNPSIVWQPGSSSGKEKKFIMSLRAVGEGHISSIAFRTGSIGEGNEIKLNDDGKYLVPPKVITGEKNIRLQFNESEPIEERIIFPELSDESNGIEDARFVEFTDDEGESTYFATYTAYDGKSIYPKLLKTNDFMNFDILPLSGTEVINKGMALFPNKINGEYFMLGRQDNENIYLMHSDNILHWNSKEVLLKPKYEWELVQLGNSGSPLKTEKGWLIITHGVGPMRTYSLGALLLELDNPSKVIGRTREPILIPNENEREGYVPNVVYACGGLINEGELVLPYAMSDSACSFVKFNLDELFLLLDDQ